MYVASVEFINFRQTFSGIFRIIIHTIGSALWYNLYTKNNYNVLMGIRMRGLGRIVRPTDGATAIEFAIVLPILVLLTMGVVECGRRDCLGCP